MVKNPLVRAGDAGDEGSIPGPARSPGVGNHRNPLQYSCLENSMDRGVWPATVHRAPQSWTRLSTPKEKRKRKNVLINIQ